jgi:hypothetical protein
VTGETAHRFPLAGPATAGLIGGMLVALAVAPVPLCSTSTGSSPGR